MARKKTCSALIVAAALVLLMLPTAVMAIPGGGSPKGEPLRGKKKSPPPIQKVLVCQNQQCVATNPGPGPSIPCSRESGAGEKSDECRFLGCVAGKCDWVAMENTNQIERCQTEGAKCGGYKHFCRQDKGQPAPYCVYDIPRADEEPVRGCFRQADCWGAKCVDAREAGNNVRVCEVDKTSLIKECPTVGSKDECSEKRCLSDGAGGSRCSWVAPGLFPDRPLCSFIDTACASEAH